jgi:hypothetical protein
MGAGSNCGGLFTRTLNTNQLHICLKWPPDLVVPESNDLNESKRRERNDFEKARPLGKLLAKWSGALDELGQEGEG